MKKITSSTEVILFIVFSTIVLISCADNDFPVAPEQPIITGLSTDNGRIGTPLRIYGVFWHGPDSKPGSRYPNRSIIKFNGVLAETLRDIYEDDVGTQSMDTYVPEGATSGKVSITIDGITASSPNDFIVTAPIYESPLITRFGPNIGLIGSSVTILGNNFVPPVPVPPDRAGLTNTSIVKFNGIIAETTSVYQIEVGKQSMTAYVPVGATTGKITVTANGITASSSEDYIITYPDYIPNVTVSTTGSIGGTGLCIDADGNLYVTNIDRQNIVKTSPDGSMTILWASDAISRETPLGVTVDKDGIIYATIENSIRKITPDGSVTTLAGSSTYGYADGSGENAKFWVPWGLTVDSGGNIYTADWLNFKIRKITPDGIVTTIAGSTKGYKDGQGTQAQFSDPIEVTLDNEGNLLVADGGKIRKITLDGFVSTIAGTTPSGYLDGPINIARFGFLRGLIVDPSGNIFLCDSGNYSVRKISLDGTVATVAGSTFGYVDGPGHLAKFGYTLGLTMDSDGALYLTQGGGYGVVRKIVID
jgi:sugar lactone lactonase YvrE